MKRPRGYRVGLALLVWWVVTHTPASAEVFEIGTVGATFEADTWERRQLTASLGPDQFALVGEDTYLVFLESFGLFERRDDFVHRLEGFAQTASANLQNPVVDAEPRFEQRDDYRRGTLYFSGSMSGIDVSYRIDLVSAGDGVGYILLGWTAKEKALLLDEWLDQALGGLSLPEPGSDWGRRSQPTPHTFDFRPWEVEMTYRDSVFPEPEVEPRTRYTLTGDEGNLAVHLFVIEQSGSIDQVLDDISSAAASGEVYEELYREDFESQIGPARRLLMRQEGPTGLDVAIATVDLGDDRWIDVRMVSSSPAGHREALWHTLLDGLSVKKRAPVDAFPEGDDDPEEAYLPPAARELLEASRFLGSAPWGYDVEVRADGELLVRDGREIARRPVDGGEDPLPPLYRSDERIAADLVVWGDEVLLVSGDGPVVRIVDGERREMDFEADRLVAAGEELVVVRQPGEPTILGVGDPGVTGDLELAIRDADGEERDLVEWTGLWIQAIGGRSGAILVATQPAGFESTPGESATELQRLSTTSPPQTKALGRWIEVERIVGAPSGWLISGEHPERGRGVFLLADDGGLELLLQGKATGLAWEEGWLLFASGFCAPGAGDSAPCLYRAPTEVVRRQGPSFWPWGVAALNRIAGEADLSKVPSSAADMAAGLERARRVARDRFGTELPASDSGLERLLGELAYERRVRPATVSLLAHLLAERLLERGAEWVPGGEVGDPPGILDSGWVTANASVVGIWPEAVVTSTLYDEDGWYRPLQEIEDRAWGRRLLVGSGPLVVREAVRSRSEPGLAALVRSADEKRIAIRLERNPDNVWLRNSVYRRLLARGRYEVAGSLARQWLDRSQVAPIDVLVAVGVRLREEIGPEEAEDMIARLRSVIESDPDWVGPYLQLGAAYERSARGDRQDLARACYEEASRRSSSGTFFDQAFEALENLEGSAPEEPEG